MTFEQFIVAASAHAHRSSKRMGESYMESLYYHRPDLYKQIISRSHNLVWNVNPHYDDVNFPNFLAFIAERW